MSQTSILEDIKKLLGGDIKSTIYDRDILIHINGALSAMQQICPYTTNVYVTDETQLWSDVYQDPDLEYIRIYIYLKVRKIFDATASASVASAIDSEIENYEWRLSTYADQIDDSHLRGGGDINEREHNRHIF